MPSATSMRAIVVRRFGGPEVLAVESAPVPAPGPGELLVEVVAAGVNPVDVSNHRDGSWAGIVPPYTPGSDVSGVVSQVGESVEEFAAGDRVVAMTDFLGTRAGSYAEYQLVPAALAAAKPPGVPHLAAAALPLAAGTAWECIERVDPGRGEAVAILGARGGVGAFATQLARGRGARVIALGRADTPAAARAREGEADVLLDLAGGLPDWLALLREGGRVATIVSLAGDLDEVIDRNLTVHGVLVRPDADRLRRLLELVAGGRLEVAIRGEYPLERAADAHREVERGGAPGKTVIRVRPG
jgi:NADPH:quinone reductase-like Zn-dependent oxidoreductase